MDILNDFADDVLEIDIGDKNIEGKLDFSRFTKLHQINWKSVPIFSEKGVIKTY